MTDGILSTSNAYNTNFRTVFTYYDIKPGPEFPEWGINNKNFSYFACEGYPDQINLYRFARLAKGGLKYGLFFLECMDGTGTLKMPYKPCVYYPWLEIPEYIEDDYDECFKQIVQHYDKTYDHITVMWSGGVDSTAIVCAFIKYCDKNKFTIGYTSGSVEEYPLFYDYLCKNNYNLIDLATLELSELPGILTFGVGGSVICDTAPIYSQRGIFELPWHYALDKEEWRDDYNSLYEFTEQYMKHYGKPNPTVADLCLFVNMGTKSNNSIMYLHYDPNITLDKLSPFYEFPQIRRWNYHHAAKYMVGSHIPSSYKIPAKDIIYSVFPDDDYYMNKTKGYSNDLWKKKCGSDNFTMHDYFFIDYNSERISAQSREHFFEKYGTRFDNYFYKYL